MKRLCFVAAMLFQMFFAVAQQAIGVSEKLVSPQINDDHSVTFRLYAPKAVRVEVTGDFLPKGVAAAEMKEDEQGVWSYTTATSLAPELYSYSFVVDGRQIGRAHV